MEARLTRELRIFHRLARVVGAGPYDVHDVLERIGGEFRGVFGFERALVVRLSRRHRTVHAVIQQNVEWPGDEWLPVDDFPFLTRAMEAGEAVFVADPAAEGAIPAPIIERFGVGSIVAVPLLIEGRCIGFLVGDRQGGRFRLTQADLDVLTALGTVAAVFIDKADQYAELKRALIELRGLDDAKTEFVSVASHELRTPIAIVHGIAATLDARGDELPADQLHDLRRALVAQTNRLVGLTQQLLDVSRLEAGGVRVRRERFRARDRVEAIAARVAGERGETVHVRAAASVELETDPVAFDRIVGNLLDNALRYGKPPIEVRVEARPAPRLVVEDRGEGVDPTFVPQLFERFTRGERSQSQADGAGLGLAIASSFAGALGGRLRYEPAEPHGARFTLELPP